MARVRWNERVAARLTSDPEGPVGRDLHRCGRLVEAQAKVLCPVSPEGSGDNPPGHLRDSIHTQPVAVDEKGMHVDVGTDVFYGIFVETGTRPHSIDSKGDYPLRNPKTGQVFGQHVDHPGTGATPFLRASLQAADD